MISKAAILIFRSKNGNKELMFVRAGNKPYFVLPGGKREPGESPEVALHRELHEELGTDSNDTRFLGVVAGTTPDGRQIEEHLFIGSLAGEPTPQSEIEAILWLDKNTLPTRQDMTPLTLDMIIPFIDAHQLW